MAAAPTKDSLLAEILGDPADALRAYPRGGVPPALLREIAVEAHRPEVRRFLAAYPETPARILQQLAEGDEPDAIREALAAHSRAPRDVLMRLAGDPALSVRMAVAANRAVTPQVALELASDEAVAVRLALAANPAVSPRAQALLAADANQAVRSALLGQGRLDHETRTRLAEGGDPLLLAETVATADASEHDLLAWADSDQLVAQTALLLRPQVPEAILESLCFSTHASVQRRAIERHRLSTDEMVGWSQAEQPAVRALVAERPSLPPAIQRLLARDASADVRRALAGNGELDEAVSCLLAEDADPAVQTALALNPQLPGSAVSLLCQSPSAVVRKLVARRPDLTEEHMALLLGEGDEALGYHLATNDVLTCAPPPDLAQRWASHRLPSLRALAARSPELPSATMEALASDPSPLVRRALAWNGALPGAVRARLASDPDPVVTQRMQAVCAEPPPEDAPSPSEPASQGFLKRLFGRMLDRRRES